MVVRLAELSLTEVALILNSRLNEANLLLMRLQRDLRDIIVAEDGVQRRDEHQRVIQVLLGLFLVHLQPLDGMVG